MQSMGHDRCGPMGALKRSFGIACRLSGGRRRIAVVGLRKAQADVVRRKCEAVARIDWVDVDRADMRLPQCDEVVLMTRFVNHGWSESAYRSFPRDRVHLHHGGMSLLVQRITAMAST